MYTPNDYRRKANDYNNKRIAEYRDKAIQSLQKVSNPHNASEFLDACKGLQELQSYLDLIDYPVKSRD